MRKSGKLIFNQLYVRYYMSLFIHFILCMYGDLRLHFPDFPSFSLLPPKINFNTRRRAFVTLHAKSISWPEDYFNLIIWFNFLFKVQEEFDYLQRAERLMITQQRHYSIKMKSYSTIKVLSNTNVLFCF